MNCQICKKDITPASDFYPFCSERCKLIDLGNWASEKYVVSSPLQPEDLEDLEDLPEHPKNDKPE